MKRWLVLLVVGAMLALAGTAFAGHGQEARELGKENRTKSPVFAVVEVPEPEEEPEFSTQGAIRPPGTWD